MTFSRGSLGVILGVGVADPSPLRPWPPRRARASAGSPAVSSIFITQQPLSLPSVCRKTAPVFFRNSNACVQKCRRRMSPSHVSRS